MWSLLCDVERRLWPDAHTWQVSHSRAETGGPASCVTGRMHGEGESRRWPRVATWLRPHAHASHAGGRDSVGVSLLFLIIRFGGEIGLQKLTLIFSWEEDMEGERVTRPRSCILGACVLKVCVLDHVRDEPGTE